jgi:alkanesulfonate monooxygenase
VRLGAFFNPTGHHVASWRHSDAQADAGVNFEHFVEISRTAERGKFDFVFFADALNVRELKADVLCRTAQYLASFEPLTLIAALAARTERIGFISTASTSYSEPYNVAREFASIDWISGGRVGWNIVTTSRDEAARNFGQTAIGEHRARYGRAREFTSEVLALWERWAAASPSPHGRPLLVQAGASDDGREFAAEYAEVVFTNHARFEAAQEYYADVKGRAQRFGRKPESLFIMPGLGPYVARTESEARERHAALQSLVDPAVGLEILRTLLGTDVSGCPLDGPLPELERPRTGSQSSFENWTATARRENLTIRQLMLRAAGAQGQSVIVGSPAQIADHMQRWVENAAADGFNIMPPYLPGALDDFVDLVIPELQERGLFHREYTGTTLRENLGLALPQREAARA